jgi:ribosomal protein L11 methyltransferase
LLQAFFIMNSHIQITIALALPEQADILIAQLAESGYEGFEEDGNELHAFIPEDQFAAEDVEAILSSGAFTYVKKIIAQKNWNEEWEKNFHPVIVDGFCAIRASFHDPVEGVKNEIIITPKMSFGTGHHATTYLMVQAMEQIDFTGKTVFDFGTGTGVLAILAEKLGAMEIQAIDIDDWSIENAKENLAANHCLRILVEKNAQIPSTKKYDIILANINKNTILTHLLPMRQQLTTGGVLLLSGLLEADFGEINENAEKTGFSVVRRISRENWICLGLEKTNL